MTRIRPAVIAAWFMLAAVLASAPAAAAPILPPLELGAVIAAVHRGQCGAILPELRALSDRSGPAGARAGYLLAHCLLQQGETDAARAAFDRVADQFPPLAMYARVYGAVAAMQGGQDGEAAARLEQVLADGSIPPLDLRARVMLAEALIRQGRYDAARAVLVPLSADTPDDASSAHVWWLRGRAAEGTGDRALALRAYGMAWWSVPEAPDAAAALERLRALQPGRVPAPPPEARVQRAGRLMGAGEFTMAEREFAAALHEPLPPPVAADTWYRLGILRLRTSGASYAFQQAAAIPGADRPRALFWLGRALVGEDRDRAAEDTWRRVIREFPASAWAPRAMLAVAGMGELRNDLAGAQRWLSLLTRQYPLSGSADEARWRMGWLAYRQRRYGDAERRFLEAAAQFPSTPRTAAHLYWAAKTRAQRGENARPLLADLAQRFPYTYYGQRAREAIKAPGRAWLPDPAAVRLSDDRASSSLEELAALGFDEDAADLADALANHSSDPGLLRTAAWMRARTEAYARSVAAAEQVIRPALYGGMVADREAWMLAYPLAFWTDVRRAAEAAGLDPYLVLAVMREESRFDPNIVSLAGAVGLLQLLPSTASGVAGSTLGPADLKAPGVNIAAGSRFLAGLMRRFNGDAVLALAAYNAGPAAARRFARLPRADPDVFIESIPFSETRGYVQRVLQTYGIYRQLYR